jgi:hypothetical protein
VKKTLIVLVLAAASTRAADPENWVSCRTWNASETDQKRVFMQGISDGMIAGLLDVTSELTDKKTEQVVQSVSNSYFNDAGKGNITYEEGVKGIDSVCIQPENIKVPAVFALKVFIYKVQGASSQDVEEYLRRYRAAFSSQPKKKEQ